jgi:hypothetical protein
MPLHVSDVYKAKVKTIPKFMAKIEPVVKRITKRSENKSKNAPFKTFSFSPRPLIRAKGAGGLRRVRRKTTSS